MPKKYPTEQRDRALRMALERLDDYPSPWAAAQALGPKLGVGPETLRKWIVQAQVEAGNRPGPSSEELAEIKALKSQVRDLTEANEPQGGLDFLRRGTRPPTPLICSFIDEQRTLGRGVESICSQLTELGLPVAPRTYRAWKTSQACTRARTDATLLDMLLHVRTGNEGRPLPEVLYGRRKMTAWLARNGFSEVSKHTVDRLMRDEGMNGLVRGRSAKTTVPAKTGGVRAGDLLNRIFTSPRPNHAWVTDFTYVRTWCGFVYVAFAIDLYSRAIVGWSAAPAGRCGLVEGLSASIGSVGDAYDNAAAETVFGLYKNEAVATGSPFRTGPLRQLADVQALTMNYVYWYNNDRLHSELGYLSPEECEQTFYALPTGSPTGDSANKKTA